jgi:hypothetical protein
MFKTDFRQWIDASQNLVLIIVAWAPQVFDILDGILQ